MYNQPAVVQTAPKEAIYKMDPAMVQSLHNMKQQIHGLCQEHMNRPVRVQTIHGQTFEGHIVHIDAVIMYLKPMQGHVRSFFNPIGAFGQQAAFNNIILPLVLYELLVISLL
ncbi:hypothetical protein [Paenibacillus agricola]|uniref:Uncharacterized protein n=1 Tax=Paenibacillus agricola TaxID=2716264 RepID=A0ABX0JCC0_9BACL|nr:hypothetical protein [Paenibacillus agricola]NHN31571.1 hypothetical protein [Paenibacillus agricola]